MMHLIRRRLVPVSFRNIAPTHIINITPFDQNKYDELRNDGLRISPLGVIHSASVHYQGRYRNSPSLRFCNAFIDLFAALSPNNFNHNLCLNDTESSEFQTRSSEVVAVGLCVNLAAKLFNINYNRIILIETTGKRCDFHLHKDGNIYLLESKGRKHYSNINSAIDDVFTKKQVNQVNPQYGIISHLPRDGSPASIIVVDPENEYVKIGIEEQVADLLTYYAKYASLAGYWRLANLLYQRVDAIRSNVPLSEFNKVPLDFENVYKLGNSYTITYGDIHFDFFRAKDSSIGFSSEYNNIAFFFALDRGLINLLVQQRFDDLLHYELQTGEFSNNFNNIEDLYNINMDGTILMGIPANDFYNL